MAAGDTGTQSGLPPKTLTVSVEDVRRKMWEQAACGRWLISINADETVNVYGPIPNGSRFAEGAVTRGPAHGEPVPGVGAAGARVKHDAQISIRLPADLLERIRRTAAAEDRTVNAVIRRALEAGVAR